MKRPLRFLLAPVLCVLCLGPAASANRRYLTYVIRPGDSAERIAAELYGNRALANLLLEFNNIPREAKLHIGQALKVPTAYRYHLNPGEDVGAVAERLVGDERRGPLLLVLSGLKASDHPPPGTELQIPFHFLYTVRKGDTLATIARAYSCDPRLLISYNFLPRAATPAPGERLIVPLTSLRVRGVRILAQRPNNPSNPDAQAAARRRAQRVATPNPPPLRTSTAVLPPSDAIPAEPGQSAEVQERLIAAQVAERMRRAEDSYREGSYAEAAAALVKLLAEVDPTEAQLVEVYRMLACCYVALGENELAVQAFREVLDRQPEFRLDPVQNSPKILAVLEAARAARAKTGQ